MFDEAHWTSALRRQLGAAIDMLENAITACPASLWSDPSRRHEFWYVAFHTLFWLDLYLFGSIEGFAPPAPFTMDELDPAGIFPERPYTKAELLEYTAHCRARCRATLDEMTEETSRRSCRFGWGEVSFAELHLYNLRHVQHHTAQLNLLLRQSADSAPGWVAIGKHAGEGT